MLGCGPSGPYENAADYTLTNESGVLAADSTEDFGILIDAVQRKDHTSVLALESRGKVFILKSGTRVLASQIESSGKICAGEVESGEYISQHIVLACSQLK